MRAALLLLLLPLAPQETEPLIAWLRDDSPEVRDQAARALRDRGEAAIPALRRAEKDADPEIRARAGDLIQRIERDGSLDPGLLARYWGLREAFEIGNYEFVVEIALKRRHGLGGYRGDFEAYGIKLLDHPDARARKAGLGLLGTRYGISRRPIAALVREIARWDPLTGQDQDSDWLSSLASSVYGLASPLDRDLLAGTRASSAEAEEMLQVLRARHGVPGAEAALPKLVESGSKRVVWLALQCVRDIRCQAARPQVLKRLDTPEWLSGVSETLIAIEDESCRQAYAELWRSTPPAARTWYHVKLLARSGAPEAAEDLMALLGSGPHGVIWEAASGLAALRERRAIDLLLSPAASPEVSSHFIACAARIMDADDLGKLVELLADPKEPRRNQARSQLMSLPDGAFRRKLVELLTGEKRPVVRDRLFDAVKCCQTEPALIQSVPDRTLEAIVREGDVNAAHGAAEILLKRKGPAAVPILEESILALGEPRMLLLSLLHGHPSDRVAAAAANWLGGQNAAYYVIPYVEKLKTEKAKSVLERAAATLPEGPPRASALAALARLRGDPPPKPNPEEHVEHDSWFHYVDSVATDAPGARDEIRKKLKENGARMYVKALSGWAHPEMIPALKKGLLGWDEGLAERVRSEGIPGPCMRSGDEVYGSDWIRALAATGDRSLEAFFIERLGDPNDGVRYVAVETVGRWKLQGAVPLLRRLVRSGDFEVRAEALEALARIGASGTKEFVLEVLRDNPHAAPHALARLGATDALGAIARLLDDPGPHAAILSALDLLSHPEVYGRIDRPIERVRLGGARALAPVLQEMLGTPVRISAGVSPDLAYSCDGTLRGAIEGFTGMHHAWYSNRMLTHLYRNGAIEICTTAEARAHWKARLAPRR